MGYRSDVTIRCEEKAFQMFKTAWEKTDFKPHRILESGEDGNYTYILNWNWVKWYGEFEDVSEIMNVCYALDEKDEDGYAYKVIEIGEDNATEEYANEAGYEVFDNFYVVVDVNLPSDIREIE